MAMGINALLITPLTITYTSHLSVILYFYPYQDEKIMRFGVSKGKLRETKMLANLRSELWEK